MNAPAQQAAATPGDPLAELRALHQSGRLAREYPAVRTLLAGLDPASLLVAGRLLERLDADEVARLHPGVPSIRVAVTSHGTVSMLQAPLTAHLARLGVLLRLTVGSYDGYVFELSDTGSGPRTGDADLVAWLLDPMMVFDDVAVPWRVQDAEAALTAKLDLIEALTDRFTAQAQGTLVLNTVPLPRRFTAQLVDYRSRARLGAGWREANARLLRLGEQRPGVRVLDLDPLLAEGIAAYEPRAGTYAKAFLSADLLAAYARELSHVALQRLGRTKKVLALDLDGTLWGGVLGDDGADGIEVADTYRGEAFRAVQKTVKQLGSQGVLVAAVSKNNPEPVSEVLRDHPRMTLREDDFVRVTANWAPKPENLRRLAESLNLGTDSFVFADDSPYECGLVRRELPEVATIHLEGDPAEHIGKLLADGWFDVPELTAEDRTRTAKYRDEIVRSDFLSSFESVEDYLRELQIQVRLEAVAEPDEARLSQLTLRTNQFNLTTRRLQPADIRARADDPGTLTLAIHARDRFGDNGLVGAVLARFDEDELHVENAVLSCRVFSRGIEQACFAAVLRHARAHGARAVTGRYARTAKNGIVADLYPLLGFERVAGDEAAATYRHNLAAIPEQPAYVRLTESFERQPA